MRSLTTHAIVDRWTDKLKMQHVVDTCPTDSEERHVDHTACVFPCNISSSSVFCWLAAAFAKMDSGMMEL